MAGPPVPSTTSSTPLHDHALEFTVPQPTFRATDVADIERAAGPSADGAREPSAAEREAKGELVQGELAGKPIWVKPVRQWRASALHALREGDLMAWAEATLSDDDWDTWLDVDPTIDEIEEFFKTINAGLGTDPGNSRASRRSSRNTRRR